MFVEVCSYRVKDGHRSEFLEIFETTAVPAIRAQGIRILGPLTDLENPNRFVWLRSYPSRAERDRTKRAFHESTAWATELGPAAMRLLESWDFGICETSAGYTQDDLAG